MFWHHKNEYDSMIIVTISIPNSNVFSIELIEIMHTYLQQQKTSNVRRVGLIDTVEYDSTGIKKANP